MGWLTGTTNNAPDAYPWRFTPNDILRKQLGTAGYYGESITPILWLHKWRPIISSLIVDDFGIDYVEEHHAKHLLSTLK